MRHMFGSVTHSFSRLTAFSVSFCRLHATEALADIREITQRDEDHKQTLQQTLTGFKEMKRLKAIQELFEQEEDMDAPLPSSQDALVSRITTTRYNGLALLKQTYQVEKDITKIGIDRIDGSAAYERRKTEITEEIDRLNRKLNDLTGKIGRNRAKSIYRRK